MASRKLTAYLIEGENVTFTPSGDTLIVSATGEAGDVTPAGIGAIPATEKGAPSGVATLNSDGKIPSSQIPSLAIGDVFIVNSQSAMLALAAQSGDVAIRSDIDTTFILTNDTPSVLANWAELNSTGFTPSDFGETLATAADASAARTALALGTAAQLNTGTTAFTVANGNDARFYGVTRNRQTGTSYTTVGTDEGKSIEMNNAASNTVTIPPNTTAYRDGTVIEIGQYGAGVTSIVRGAGVTFFPHDRTLVLEERGAKVSAHKIGTNEWWITGGYVK